MAGEEDDMAFGCCAQMCASSPWVTGTARTGHAAEAAAAWGLPRLRWLLGMQADVERDFLHIGDAQWRRHVSMTTIGPAIIS